MTEKNKQLYKKLKERKNFKIDYNGKFINREFLNFDNIKINLDMYNNIQNEQDYLDLIIDIRNCLPYTLKIDECKISKSKIKSIA